jgi:hypothetical protein
LTKDGQLGQKPSNHLKEFFMLKLILFALILFSSTHLYAANVASDIKCRIQIFEFAKLPSNNGHYNLLQHLKGEVAENYTTIVDEVFVPQKAVDPANIFAQNFFHKYFNFKYQEYTLEGTAEKSIAVYVSYHKNLSNQIYDYRIQLTNADYSSLTKINESNEILKVGTLVEFPKLEPLTSFRGRALKPPYSLTLSGMVKHFGYNKALVLTCDGI